MSATDVTPAAEPETTAPETTAPEASPGGERPPNGRRVALALTAALLVALAAVAATLGWNWYQAAALAQDRKAASTAARTAVVDLLSYDYRTLDADLARGRQGLAPGFRQEYERVTATSVRPIAAKQQVVTTATVPAVSIVSATRESVEVLMFVDQLTTSADQKNVVNVSRVQVTMVPSDGRWLVSALRAL